MTPSQITRTINWIAMPLALAMLAMVAFNVYQHHFVQPQAVANYQFDDLPSVDKAPITAEIKDIMSRHIFGVIPTATVTAPPKVVKKEPPKPAPKTQLNIKLTGVIDSETPESGMAFVEVERGRTLVVAVGDKIGKTDARLHQVLPGEILIDRDGTIESVKMVRKTLSMQRNELTHYDNLPQPYVASDADQEGGETYGSTAAQQRLPGADDTAVTGERRKGTRESMPTMRSLPVPGKLRNIDDEE